MSDIRTIEGDRFGSRTGFEALSLDVGIEWEVMNQRVLKSVGKVRRSWHRVARRLLLQFEVDWYS